MEEVSGAARFNHSRSTVKCCRSVCFIAAEHANVYGCYPNATLTPAKVTALAPGRDVINEAHESFSREAGLYTQPFLPYPTLPYLTVRIWNAKMTRRRVYCQLLHCSRYISFIHLYKSLHFLAFPLGGALLKVAYRGYTLSPPPPFWLKTVAEAKFGGNTLNNL